jgi:predicted nucleotidyltransferase
MPVNERLAIDKDQIVDFCRRHYVIRLAVLGSALRADFGPDSNIDILVDFGPGRVPRFFRPFDMEEELSALFGGCNVDLRTREDLSRYLRDKVVAQAKVQYARG